MFQSFNLEMFFARFESFIDKAKLIKNGVLENLIVGPSCCYPRPYRGFF